MTSPPDDLRVALARLLEAAEQIAAWHEAAHVVAASVVGGRVRSATIVPSIEDGKPVDGAMIWTPPEGLGAREHAVVALAGGILSGRGCVADEADARALADALIEEWREEARELVERNSESIGRVAAMLLARRTLTEQEIGDVLASGADPPATATPPGAQLAAADGARLAQPLVVASCPVSRTGTRYRTD